MKFLPETDTALFKNFGSKDLKARQVNKTELAKTLELTNPKHAFFIGVSTAIQEAEHGEIIIETIQALLELDMVVIVCARFDKRYEKIFAHFVKTYPKYFSVLEVSPENKSKLHASCDAELFLFHNKDTESVLQQSTKYGAVPISIGHEGLKNYDALEEEGNAFTIEKMSMVHALEASIRARENFRFPYDWNTIVRSAMGTEITEETIEI